MLPLLAMADSPRPRRRGSVRFDPYYKAQFFRPLDFSWQDIQQRCATLAGAQALFTPGKRWRVMRIDMRGRAPVPGSDTLTEVE